MQEPNSELEIKQKDFLEKYGKLVEETGIDMAVYPMFVPDGQGGFKVICQSVPVDVKI